MPQLFKARQQPATAEHHAEADVEAQGQRIALGCLVLALAIGPFVLVWAGGPPHLPAVPNWRTIAATLSSSEIPIDAVLYLFSTAAWLLWLWLAATTLVRALIAVAETLTRGAAWVHSLRAASDPFTLPIIRRVVDGALVAGVVVSLAGRATPAAAADLHHEVAVAQIIFPTAVSADVSPPLAEELVADGQQDARPVAPSGSYYTVVEGDSLWRIAEERYGNGAEFERILAANVGRQMADGRRFSAQGVIYPGWQLFLPDLDGAADVTDQRVHVVDSGQTLGSIAASELGSPERWPEIYALNRGKARLPDGRVLTNPNLIWPGLPLVLPSDDTTALAEHLPTQAAATGAAAASESDETAPISSTVVNESPATAPDQGAAADARSGAVSGDSQGAALASAAAPAITEAPSRAPEPPSPARDELAVRLEVPRDTVMGLPAVSGHPLAAAAAVGAAGTAGLAIRRFRRSLADPPVDADAELGAGVSIHDGFADAQVERAFAHRMQTGDAEPGLLIAERVLDLLRERGARNVVPVLVTQGRSLLGLTAQLWLRADPAEQARVVELAPALGTHLGGRCVAQPSLHGDIVLKLTRIRPARLLAPAGARPPSGAEPAPSEARPHAPLWVALGVTPAGAVAHANWRQLGHTLVAGSTEGAAGTIVTSVVAALAARVSPDGLRIAFVGEGKAVPDALRLLPHVTLGTAGHGDVEQAANPLPVLYADLLERISGVATGPDVVLVVEDPAQVAHEGPEADAFEAILIHGPRHGVSVLAVTGRPDAVADHALNAFATRIVFQTPTEEESILLLGCPDAADLGEGGNVLVRIGAREPIRLRGFRTPGERLGPFVAALRDAYGARPVVAEAVAPPPAAAEIGGGTDEPMGRADSRPGDAPITTSDPAGAHPVSAGADDRLCSAEGDREVHIEVEEAPGGASDGRTHVVPVNGGNTGGAHELHQPAAHDPQSDEAPAPAEAFDVHTSSAIGPATVPPVAVAMVAAPVHDLVPAAPPAPAASGVEVLPPTPPAAPVRVRLLGELEIVSDDGPVSLAGKDGMQYQAREVLTLLAAQPGGATTRERMLNALWREVDTQRGAKRLTVAMQRVRDWLRPHVPALHQIDSLIVACERDGRCTLDPRAVWADTQEFIALIKRAATLPPAQAMEAYARARALYRGELLTNTSYVWIDDRIDGATLREYYWERYRHATLEVARLHREAGDLRGVAAVYRDVLRLEPTLEEAARELFRVFHQMGDLKALVLEERRLRNAIKELMSDPGDPDADVDCYEPEAETIELFRELVADLQRKAAARTRTEAPLEEQLAAA